MWQRTLLLAGVLLAGCATSTDRRSPIVGESRPSTSSAQVVVIDSASAVRPGASTVPATLADSRAAVSESVEPMSSPACARNFVEAILRSDLASARELAAPSFVDSVQPWVGPAVPAEVIDVLVLATAAGHSRIGVGVAFQPAADGTITEPIAYVVDVVSDPGGCWVIGVTYA